MNNRVLEGAVFSPNDPQKPEPNIVSGPGLAQQKDEGGRMKDEKAEDGSGSSFILHPSSLHATHAFFQEYFRELEQRNIPYVILHDYEELPNRVGSDIDYAVPNKYLVEARGVLAEVAQRRGWVVA